MAKAKRHKKTVGQMTNGERATREQTTRDVPVSRARGQMISMGSQSLQNVVFSIMIALGCWGMAFFFVFLYGEERNHTLYGGIMAVTALIWSIMAARKWSAYRQRA